MTTAPYEGLGIALCEMFSTILKHDMVLMETVPGYAETAAEWREVWLEDYKEFRNFWRGLRPVQQPGDQEDESGEDEPE